VAAAIWAGAQVSVTVRLDPKVTKAIASIPEDAWAPIAYTDAVFDDTTHSWISRAEVAKIGFTAFSSKKPGQQVPGRLVVRRIPDLNPHEDPAQATLFDTWRFHAFFTTSELDTITADTTHRHHAIIEQVHADLKNSALAHLPSSRFAANGAWLVLATMAFNLTRAVATTTGSSLAKATTATIRRTLITVPARIASSAPVDHPDPVTDQIGAVGNQQSQLAHQRCGDFHLGQITAVSNGLGDDVGIACVGLGFATVGACHLVRRSPGRVLHLLSMCGQQRQEQPGHGAGDIDTPDHLIGARQHAADRLEDGALVVDHLR